MHRDRLVQLALVMVAAAALAGAAALHGVVRAERTRHGLITHSADDEFAKDPKIALLQIVPGGLRAPFLTYLWIRSQELKNQGRFFDAQQLRELICEMMPHFPGVWGFLAWDMAWNISVATHTPDERWMWVSNGMRLLRDKGLRYNPDDLLLYKELAWIFFSKIGQYLDEMHLVYKRRWAAEMQAVVGAPPFSDDAREVIAAFRPIAEAPSRLADLKADKAVRAFVDRLAAAGVAPGAEFLRYHNRFSGAADLTRPAWIRAEAPADAEKPIAALMAGEEFAAARAAVLAYSRRKVLLQTYRMDPAWMLQLMEKYGPLDWRHPNAHAIYWATVGLHTAEGKNLHQINALNTDRIVLGALKGLTRTGQLFYTPNPDQANDPFLDWGPDWRFIGPTHREYVVAGRLLTHDGVDLADDSNTFRDGHVTYLNNAIQELYVGNRRAEAQKHYDNLRTLLKPAGEMYELDLDAFVRARRAESGTPTTDVSRSFWFNALRSAYRALAGGRRDQFRQYHAFARRAYREFVRDAPPRLKGRIESFEKHERNFLAGMLVNPSAFGLRLPLEAKSGLYGSLPPGLQSAVYPLAAPALRAQCTRQKKDFDIYFPAPDLPASAPTTAPAGRPTPAR